MTGSASQPSADANRPSGVFFLNVNLVFASTLLSYGLGFLVIIALSRLLGPDGRGLTALYQAGVYLGFAFLGLGIEVAVVYFLARRDITARQSMEAGLSVTLFSAALSAVATGIVALSGISTSGIPYAMAIVCVPAVVQFYLLEGVLRAQARYLAVNVLQLLLPVTILASFAALELTVGLTVSNAVYAWSLAFLAPVAFGYACIGVDAWARRPAPLSLLLPTVRFGAQGQLTNLIQLLNFRLDSYLVLLFVNAGGVGLYAVGVALSEGLWFVANSVAVVFLTDVTAGSEAHAARMTPFVCRNTIALTLLAALVAASVSPIVIPLIFGEDFTGAVSAFLWLLPGTVALAGTKILGSYLISRGRPMLNASIAVRSLFVALVMDLILIPLFGVDGAAAASSIGYSTSLVLTAIAYRRLSGGSIVEALAPRPADIGFYLDGMRAIAGRLGLVRT